MSLKLRIDILIGVLLFFGLAADIGRMIVAAGARVRIESESNDPHHPGFYRRQPREPSTMTQRRRQSSAARGESE